MQSAENNTLTINIGYISSRDHRSAPDHVTYETPNANTIVVKGIDKQQVGALAADIREVRKPEPYHGQGHPLSWRVCAAARKARPVRSKQKGVTANV